ncbi:hypothetical protein BH11PLA1_BH11PLA1_00320 [soil metagenome]
MTQALTRYQALYQSVRSRRRELPAHKGLDRFAATLLMRGRARRSGMSALRAEAAEVVALRPRFADLSNAELDGALLALRERFVRRLQRESPTLLIEGLAAAREVARRTTGQEAYPVQIMGALGLYHGRIVEMLTGEGKTLTGSLAAVLLAWRHRSLHVFTVNDYLAKRDAESREPIYTRCGLTVGAIQQDLEPKQRCDVYARSIVYGTPKQITADWLRDQLRLNGVDSAWTGRRRFGMDEVAANVSAGRDLASASGLWEGGAMIPGLHAALVDEADAVLIDEGVTPLIIAQTRKLDEMAEIYKAADALAGALSAARDFKVDALRRRVTFTDGGLVRAEAMLATRPEPLFKARRRALELVRTALVARHVYKRGQHYGILDGRIVIVDEFTGRFLADRSWEHGLHQAVEAKEEVEVTADRETLARLSFQRFFRTYPFLSGMTGTAADATGEMESTYQRPVTVVPTNRPVARVELPPRAFRTAAAKLDALVRSAAEQHALGRPVLIGTRSIEASEAVAARLSERNIEHRVLNANFDKEEAAIIAEAGRRGAVTVATNMAGRGTDIELDKDARKAGGLHVILTEMHAARRIDRQFIGRAGRQGDPGSAQIFIALQDELPRLFTPGIARWLRRATSVPGAWDDELSGWPRALALAMFKRAQQRAQRRDRGMRAQVLKQDTWIESRLFGA